MGELTEVPIAPPPGVVKTDSSRVIEGRWSDVINMRFVKRLPQKIGGWVKAFTALTDGTPRALHAWRDLSFNAFLGVGTFRKLYIYDQNGAQNDITPYRAQGTLPNNPLSTLIGSTSITVHHPAHGTGVGDIIYIAGSTAIGGITPNVSPAFVDTVIDADNYTYLFTSPASSTVSGGGGTAVTFKYEIPVGVELGAFGYGWGVGGWGLGTWGTARSTSTVQIEPRVWSLDNFGVLELAAYNGGTIYKFDPTVPQPWGRAIVISADPGLPTNVRAMFVTPERFVFALCDGMQVKWPSQGTLDIWTPATGNTANIRTLTEGSKLVGGAVLSEFVSLVWTDAALYKFQYTGATYVYSSGLVGKNCGLISPNAKVTAGGVAYWIGQNTLWNYNGTVLPMPNVDDIRKWVFDQIDINLGYQCNATYSPTYNEVFFYFTAMGQTNPTFGMIYSIDQQCWAPLYWGRAGGAHLTQGDTRPYFGASDGTIYQHENGFDANGAILPYSMTLAPYALSKGGRYNYLVEHIVTDFFGQIGDISVTLTSWDRLNDSVALETETDTVAAIDSGTDDARIGGRYIGITMGASSLGSYVRLGLPVAFIRPMGDRS